MKTTMLSFIIFLFFLFVYSDTIGTDSNINLVVPDKILCTPPPNNSCSTAFDLGTGFGSLQITGNNICADAGGQCSAPNNESTVYFTYTVPTQGLTRLLLYASNFFIGASTILYLQKRNLHQIQKRILH